MTGSKALVLLLASGAVLGSDPCISEYNNQPCLGHKDLPKGFWSYLKKGDPCFDGQCFISASGAAAGCKCASPPLSLGPPSGPHSCTSDYGNKCLGSKYIKDKGWWDDFSTGDPCFSYKGQKVCYTKKADPGNSMEPCSCTNEPTVLPKCEMETPKPSSDTCEAQKKEYCAIYSKHTMCEFCGVGERCLARGKLCSIGLTKAEKDEIIKTHNDLRRKVAKGEEKRGLGSDGGPQPTAANMYEVKWNDQLASIAQEWAQQCSSAASLATAHDKNDARKTEKMPVGQNRADSWLPYMEVPAPVAKMVTEWYDEVKDFSKTMVDPFVFGEKTGHYSQLVWATSKEVGCGYIQYPSSYKGKPMNQLTLVCNYGPAGNLSPGGVMYKVGKTASDCPNGDNDGLCKW